MPALLVIGNKNYSSWSLRAWLALRHFDIPFEEERIALDQPDSHERILRRSPAGRVPVLVDGEVTVWDSLAIAEYASERWLSGGGWPDGVEARAVARSVSAEMHSGFPALRAGLPMNCRAQNRQVAMSPAARADVARVTALLADCRRRFGGGGAWLFGGFSIADAMYAPVAFRFATYGVRPGGPAGEWCEALLRHPRVREWAAAAAVETEVIAADEAGEAA
jgi:glutathione S-transferase